MSELMEGSLSTFDPGPKDRLRESLDQPGWLGGSSTSSPQPNALTRSPLLDMMQVIGNRSPGLPIVTVYPALERYSSPQSELRPAPSMGSGAVL